ncbi:MAG TPA: tetratricopeptide repeat protein [Kofleriaceae bacterium]|nr:tetratricopeptide repeat protein [Kofleriaceae bacterium]
MSSAPARCLPEDVVIAFFDGTLDPAQLAELEAHVDDCASCRAWLSGMAVTLDGGSGRPAGGRCFADGAVVAGRYRIVRFVAAGGMGEVYEAEDQELHQAIALKTVTAVLVGDRDAVARLRDEVALARKVTHRNACRIFDFGTDDAAGVAFLTMELLAGETLAVRLARTGALAPRDALPLAVQMADGLAAAHAAGVVHRDLKPHNVIVVGERAVLTDFGLAAALDDARSSAPVGTPHYMAPEQLTGGPITVATDVYAFGVVLYQMVTGELPGGVRPALDPRWARAIERCLERDPAKRFASVRDVVRAIVPPPRRRARWLAAAGALAIAAGAFGIASWRREPAAPCRGADRELAQVWGAAERQRVHAAFLATGAPYAEDAFEAVARTLDGYGASWTAMRSEACEATRVRGTQSDAALGLRMACLDDRRDQLAAQVAQLERADLAVVRRGGEAPGALAPIDACANLAALESPVRVALAPADAARDRELRARLDTAKAMRAVGHTPQAIPIASAVRDGARELHDAPLQAEAALLLGQLQLDARAWQLADPALVEAATAALAAKDDLVGARAWAERLRLLGEVRMQFDQARELEPFARAALERIGSPRDELAFLEMSVGLMYEEHGDLEIALAHDEKALQLAGSSLLGARVTEVIGTVDNRLGKWADARDHFTRALAMMRTQLGEEHPIYGSCLCLYGEALWGLGRQDEAIDAQRRGIAIQQRVLGDDPDVAYGMLNLAIALKSVHKLDEAIALEERVVAILDAKLGPVHADIAQALGNLGRSYLEHGEPARDLASQQRALAIATSALGADHPDRAFYLQNIGEAELALAEPGKAVAPLEQSVAIQAAHPQDPDDLALAKFLLARALWGSGGDRSRARSLATAARTTFATSQPPVTDQVAAIDRWLAAPR